MARPFPPPHPFLLARPLRKCIINFSLHFFSLENMGFKSVLFNYGTHQCIFLTKHLFSLLSSSLQGNIVESKSVSVVAERKCESPLKNIIFFLNRKFLKLNI